MPKPLPPVDELVGLLTAHPQRLAEVTAQVPAAKLARPPANAEWSPVEILAHMRACGDMWGGAIETILADDHPTIKAINPRTWIESTNYRNLDFAPSFRAYRRQRMQLLALLQPLSAKDWKRSARVTGAGPVLELTVHHYAERLAIHERPHVKQIYRAVGET